MLALILDRTHAVLVAGDRLPDVAVDGPRPLRTLEASLEARGIALPSPAGSRARSDGGRDFAFVVERFDAPAGLAWRPLRDASSDDALWNLYVELMLGGWEPPTRAVDVWAFGGTNPKLASMLNHLVVCGAKRVTTGWREWCVALGIPLAYEGAINIVTDGFGYPRMVTRSVEVRDLPFGEVDAASAAGEGEGDLTYDDWRELHVMFFEREAAKLGLVFDDHTRVLVERFEILHVVGARTAR
jgi:uncharacterized protein YhfF